MYNTILYTLITIFIHSQFQTFIEPFSSGALTLQLR